MTNILLIMYCFIVGIIVTIAMVFHMTVIKSRKYPHVGVMHASMVFAHTVIYVYISLGNTEGSFSKNVTKCSHDLIIAN